MTTYVFFIEMKPGEPTQLYPPWLCEPLEFSSFSEGNEVWTTITDMPDELAKLLDQDRCVVRYRLELNGEE